LGVIGEIYRPLEELNEWKSQGGELKGLGLIQVIEKWFTTKT